MSDIKSQFDKIRDFIVSKDNYDEIIADLAGFDIDNSLKLWLMNQASVYIGAPIMFNNIHCLNDSQDKNDFLNFLFCSGESSFENFLNNKNIDAQDKFYALVTKYIIISTLPEKFKSVKDQEMNLLYNNIEDTVKNYAEYIKTANGESIEANFVLTNSLTKIIDDVFSECNKTDYNKDVKFITDIYSYSPILNKDRLINFQGQPLFNRSIQLFLKNPRKNNEVINFFQESVRKDPSLIYKFSTTTDSINRAYEAIDGSKNFSGNFICNFPDAISVDGNVTYGETRCQPNVLSEILFALNYNKIPEDNKADIVQLLCSTLDSLCAHIESLKQSNNSEELQKINYLLNCPIKAPMTNEFFTPMNLIYKIADSGIYLQQQDLLKYAEQLKVEPVYLQTIDEMRNSIEFKKAVRRTKDEKETRVGNEEIKKLQEELSIAEEKAKRTMAYRFFNTLSKFFLRRETKYKTEQQKLAEKKLNEKMVELSKPFFTSASKVTDQQMTDLKLSKQQERLATLNYDRNKSTVDIRTVS